MLKLFILGLSLDKYVFLSLLAMFEVLRWTEFHFFNIFTTISVLEFQCVIEQYKMCGKFGDGIWGEYVDTRLETHPTLGICI